jgi:3-oxoacyl-[acyl-carrier protein] reductase
VAGDVLDDNYIKTLISKAAEFGGGKIHIIVNNAGYTWDGVIHKMTDKQWHTIVDLHATAPFKIVRAAAPYFRVKDGEPRCIINISSTSGVNGNAGQINYALAKAGVQGITKTIAKEYVPVISHSASFSLTYGQMGSPIRRPRKHRSLRTHPDALDGSERRGRLHHHTRWRKGRAGHTAGAEGGCEGPGTYGYPTEETWDGDGGGERGVGGRESAV